MRRPRWRPQRWRSRCTRAPCTSTGAARVATRPHPRKTCGRRWPGWKRSAGSRNRWTRGLRRSVPERSRRKCRPARLAPLQAGQDVARMARARPGGHAGRARAAQAPGAASAPSPGPRTTSCVALRSSSSRRGSPFPKWRRFTRRRTFPRPRPRRSPSTITRPRKSTMRFRSSASPEGGCASACTSRLPPFSSGATMRWRPSRANGSPRSTSPAGRSRCCRRRRSPRPRSRRVARWQPSRSTSTSMRTRSTSWRPSRAWSASRSRATCASRNSRRA